MCYHYISIVTLICNFEKGCVSIVHFPSRLCSMSFSYPLLWHSAQKWQWTIHVSLLTEWKPGAKFTAVGCFALLTHSLGTWWAPSLHNLRYCVHWCNLRRVVGIYFLTITIVTHSAVSVSFVTQSFVTVHCGIAYCTKMAVQCALLLCVKMQSMLTVHWC